MWSRMSLMIHGAATLELGCGTLRSLWYVAHDAFGRYQWCFNVEFYAISNGAHDALERNIGAWMRNVVISSMVLMMHFGGKN